MQNQIIRGNAGEARLLTEPEAMAYVNMGRTAFRAWAVKIGALKKRGRRNLYDRVVIDNYLDDEQPSTFGTGNGVPAEGGDSND